MIFNFGNKKKSKPTETDITTDTSGVLATDLYKQNINIAFQNKSLTLLKKLYEITLNSLNLQESAELITKAIQQEMSFELVSIMLFDKNKLSFLPLGFYSSDRLTVELNESGTDFRKIKITPKAGDLLQNVIINKAVITDATLEDIWGVKIKKETYATLKAKKYVRSSIISPLIIKEKMIGISIFSINRTYDDLDKNETELITNINQVISITIDRSLIYDQLHETNMQLEASNSRLQVLDQQKSEFVSLASHQLRGPLTAIKGYISLVLEGDYGQINKDVKEALEKVQTSSNDLALLVGDYLDVSRIELGHMKYNFTSFSLNDLLDEVLNEIRPTIEKAGLKLLVDIDKLPANVHADRSKIKQVILNLMDNSVKYTPKGSLKVVLDRIDHSVLLSIKDTGVGMKKEVIPNLFAKFSRAPNASKTNIIGTGLGLYVAKQIMNEHDGEIWAESEGEGKGSTFSMKLKLV